MRQVGKEWGARRCGARCGHMMAEPSIWTFTAAILTRFDGDPTQIVTFAVKATSAHYARFAPLIFKYAAEQGPLRDRTCEPGSRRRYKYY